MNKEQIINLWKSVGWNDLKSYLDHINSAKDNPIFDELHPDTVNSKLLWEVAAEYFGTDPVCNHRNNFDRVLSLAEANHQNYILSHYVGMNGQTDLLCFMLNKVFGRIDVAEIGSGYGSFESLLYKDIENKYYTKSSYTGFDIVKRLDTTIEIAGEDGTFSDEQVKNYKEKFNLFYSSNTFQHLSPKKIENYLKQVYEMLPYGGYFNLMYVIGIEKTYHYGQVVDIIQLPNLIKMIKSIGYEVIGSTTLEMENSITPFSYVLKK